MGAITKDFRAHQYFSSPNQMIANTNSHHFGYYPSFMAYCPGHTVSCCTGNINRMMPYYAMQMWLKTSNKGIAAALFGPSEVSFLAGKNGTAVRITQATRYPFEEGIEFVIHTKKNVSFEFLIRIPGWCNQPDISLNGEKLNERPEPGTFFSIERTFSDGDVIELSLPMEIKTATWPNRGISFEHGPLVYSFAIPDSSSVVRDYEKSTADFPAYDLYPADDWQYSPQISSLQEIELVRNTEFRYPWDRDAPPVKLRIPARRVENWNLEAVKVEAGNHIHYHISGFPEEPRLSAQPETIELVPYGCTQLRVTVFPQVGSTPAIDN